MIASVHGKITYLTPQLRKDSYFVVEAFGVGYKIFTSGKTVASVRVGQDVTVFTYLSVSERALDLYGFLQPADKTFFSLLLTVPGIGPKSAIAILDKASMHDVQQAVLNDDPSILTKMAGMTLKTAEKIVVALKDKVESLTSRTSGKASNATDADAFDVLESFGYTAAEARRALEHVGSDVTSTAERVRQALRILSAGKNK